MTKPQAGQLKASPRYILLGLLLAAAAALLLVSPPPGVPPLALKGGAAVLVAIGLWATAVLAEYLTAILFFCLTLVLGIAPPQVVFAGFHSTAVWLVFGGMVIGLAVKKSGLADRAVRLCLLLFGASYPRLVVAIATGGLLLAFVMPSSMGRVLLMMPIVLTLADNLGLGRQSKGRAGLVLAAAMGTMLPSYAVLPANVPNMVMVGAAESIYGLGFLYADYLLLNFPVLGVVTAFVVPLLILWILPDQAGDVAALPKPTPWSGGELKLLAVMGVTVTLWAMDFWHGVSPAWVALGAAVLLLLPRGGVIPASAIAEINFAPWIFVAGVIGLGAVASHTGAADLAGGWLLARLHLAELAAWQQYAGMLAVGMLVALMTGLPAAPAIMTPLAAELSRQTGWPLESVLMVQVPTWIAFAFAYQAPPIIVALSLGQIRLGRVGLLMLAYFAVGVVITLPLHYLWGRFLGVFP